MESILSFIKSEWSVISQAPFTFAILAALMFGTSYVIHRDIIRRLKEQKQIRDDDLNYLKNKTGSDDIKEVAERLSGLEEELKVVKASVPSIGFEQEDW